MGVWEQRSGRKTRERREDGLLYPRLDGAGSVQAVNDLAGRSGSGNSSTSSYARRPRIDESLKMRPPLLCVDDTYNFLPTISDRSLL